MKTASAVVLILGLQIFTLPSVHAGDRIVVPDVPADIEAPAGFKAFFAGHAVGPTATGCSPPASSSASTRPAARNRRRRAPRPS
jgi:hypothetical protein